MPDGIYAQVRATGVTSCPVTSLAGASRIESVVTNPEITAEGAKIVGELTVSDPSNVSSVSTEMTEIFSEGSASVYRFQKEDSDCPCGRIPAHGCPVRDIRATDGALTLSFLAPDLDTLQSIIADLRTYCESVEVCRLTQSAVDDQSALLVVDRSAFTDRQYEVLQTAHEMGYFERPKAARSTDVAAELGISVSTFSEHLATAQAKLMDQILSA